MLIPCPKCRGKGFIRDEPRPFEDVDCAFCDGTGQVARGTRWTWRVEKWRLRRERVINCILCHKEHPITARVCVRCGYNMRHPEPLPPRGSYPTPWF